MLGVERDVGELDLCMLATAMASELNDGCNEKEEDSCYPLAR